MIKVRDIMIIISPETDYYDTYSKIYGIDRKAVFRREITYYDKYSGKLRFQWLHQDDLSTNKIKTIQYDESVNFNDYFPAFEYKVIGSRYRALRDTTPYIVLCGKIFKLVEIGENGALRKASENLGKIKRYEVYIPKQHSRFYLYDPYKPNPNIQFNKESKFFIDLCRRVKLPLFIAYPDNKEHIIDIYPAPLLCTVGMQSIYSPEKLYQDIEYYLLNVINESPDTMPMGNPAMTNKEKILSKGFDYKKSFRKRGNSSK